ncbi:low molecular weight phosphatase family protein [Corynebacterium sphenisci]|uniref:arsenate-mycothiol transferase ArsC n=1 Tax=Corynebacterium sphenisci TaxID=191493 RepID=UPI0026DEAEC3|nr:low molecular weight phosphatase family protein [Corynebacterium sphenisci]MDO5730176.1 low molecular weight phosphatase family protein [Corynebacterium sphenisci]
MTSAKPTVYFLCNSNCGKSQMAEALLRRRIGDAAEIRSAGLEPGERVNAEAAASVARAGGDMSGAVPEPVDRNLAEAADHVIVVGAAEVGGAVGAAEVERWEIDEPALRGIEGAARMDLIRDQIDARAAGLADRLGR